MRQRALPLLTALVALLSAGDALGAEHKFRACSPSAPAGDLQSTATELFGRSWGPYAVAGSCPSGLAFDTSQPAVNGDYGYWVIEAPGGMSIDSLSLTHEGGDLDSGVEYTVAACSNSCPALANISPAPPGISQTIKVEQTLGTAYVRATCRQTSCAAGESLRFNDIVITTHDDAPPRAQLNLPIVWVRRQNFTSSYSLIDWPGVGLGWHEVTIDSPTSPPVGTGCEMTDAPGAGAFLPMILPCASQTGNKSVPVKLWTLPDGRHTATLHATDAAGNRIEPLTEDFELDDTPPGTPLDAEVSPTKNGWSSANYVTASWDNPDEKYESATESGLKYAYYAMVPRGAPVSSATPVQGFAPSLGVYRTVVKDIPAREDGAWDLYVWMGDWAGNAGGKARVRFGLDRDFPEAPLTEAVPWLSRATLNEGFDLQWLQPENAELESGICGYAVGVSQSPASLDQAITHPGVRSSAPIPKNAPAGESWLLVRAVSCAGLASPVSAQRLRVDDEPPTTTISGPTGSAWTRTAATFEISASDQASGVKSIEYRIDDSPATTVEGDHASIQLASGVHEVRALATDVAGNRSDWVFRMARVDTEAPAARFAPRDSLRPSQFRATLTDDESGVATAVIQLAALDDNPLIWRPLPTAAVPSASGDGSVEISTEIEDGRLAPGRYRIRVIVSDVAGNVRVAVAEDLALPLREKSRLSSALAKTYSRCLVARGRRCTTTACRRSPEDCKTTRHVDEKRARQSRTIGYGERAQLIGELRDSLGRPIPEAAIQVYSETPPADGSAGPRVRLARASTDRTGRYSVPIPRGANRKLVVVYEGSEQRLPAEARSDLGVKAGVAFKAVRSRVRAGRLAEFTGQILSPGLTDSRERVHVSLSFWNGTEWQAGIRNTRTGRDGKFSILYSFKNAYLVKVRATANSERSAWPFMDGHSRPVVVRVLPRKTATP